tara:strand:- start:479 stop:1066 length:588 start_codon:yes stop_codon:yes gene_type:complete
MAMYCNARKRGSKSPKLEPSSTKTAGYCGNHAGSGTDHVGQGRCKFHGGLTPIHAGIYSKIKRDDMRVLIDHFENAPDPLDLAPEVAMARAFLTKFINNYDDVVDGLLEWYGLWCIESEPPHGKPPRVPSETAIISLLDTVSKIVKRIQEIKSDHTVTRRDLFRIMDAMGRVVEKETDPDTWKRIQDAWYSIKLA